MNGTDLLAEFRTARAESAFSELVCRYTNLVFSVARRRTGELALAQEVTQIVFIRLAKSPPSLRTEPELLAWLHRTTVHVSIDLWRSETRRRAREQHAIAMEPNCTEETAWTEIRPVLDEALDQLNETDRQAILLRFFEQKTMRDLGRVLEVSEDAAKMRVSRALERLRTQLAGLGVTCSAVVLGTLLFVRSVEAAPEGVAASLSGLRVPAAAGGAGAVLGILLQAPKAQLFAGIAAATLIGGAALLFFGQPWKRSAPSSPRAGTAVAGLAANTDRDSALAADSGTNAAGASGEPDAYKLLQGVVRARQRIATGLVEFEIASSGGMIHKDGTNQVRVKVLFEDGRFRSETWGTEYSYITPVPGTPEAEAIIKRADLLDRETAVIEGLLKPFTSHHVMLYNGQAVTDYWESDGPPRTDIDLPGRRGSFIFDPRCLGLSTSFYVEQTVERCVPIKSAKSVRLAGRESVENKPAWHLELRSDSGTSYQFWLAIERPTQVLKSEWNGNIAISKYSDADAKNPLPMEVKLVDYRNGVPSFETRAVRVSAQYGVPIDPVSWRFESLGMKIGAWVVDCRNNRSLGYWNGTGLSENVPAKTQPAGTATAAPDRAELMALLEDNPASAGALEAAQWILLNTPDGEDVNKAAEVILKEHIRDTNLVKLTQELERLRPNCSSNLLQAMLDKNPSADVRGNACLALATLRKDGADYGRNKPATAEAEKLYERVLSDFSEVKQRGYSLAELAKPELSELRRLTIGKAAPEIEGEDLTDAPLKLSDYRGNVVVLVFWSAACLGESQAYEYRRLADQMQGKQFVLLGIHADDNDARAKAVAEKYELNWRSFKDARSGPISKTYNINSWLTIYVLDKKGIIRNRGQHFASEVAKSVNELLQE